VAIQEESTVPAWTRRTGIEGRESKDPVHQSGAHSHEQGRGAGKPSLEEDGCRVVGDNIDTAKLLREHQKARSLSGTPVSWHPEELQDEVTTFLNVRLSFQESICIEHIAGSLDRCGPKTQHGGVGIDVTTLTYVLKSK